MGGRGQSHIQAMRPLEWGYFENAAWLTGGGAAPGIHMGPVSGRPATFATILLPFFASHSVRVAWIWHLLWCAAEHRLGQSGADARRAAVGRSRADCARPLAPLGPPCSQGGCRATGPSSSRSLWPSWPTRASPPSSIGAARFFVSLVDSGTSSEIHAGVWRVD